MKNRLTKLFAALLVICTMTPKASAMGNDLAALVLQKAFNTWPQRDGKSEQLISVNDPDNPPVYLFAKLGDLFAFASQVTGFGDAALKEVYFKDEDGNVTNCYCTLSVYYTNGPRGKYATADISLDDCKGSHHYLPQVTSGGTVNVSEFYLR